MVGGYGNTIPEFFVKYREHGGYSQPDLARLLKVTAGYICNVENGRNPRPTTLIVTLSKFLDGPRKNHLHELLNEAIWAHAECVMKGKYALKKRDKQKGNKSEHR